MKKVFKWIGILIAAVVVILIGVIGYVKLMLPNVGDAPDLKVEVTPERVERGRYLANSVTICMDCHSKRDWTKFSGPITPGTEGGGGEMFDRTMGFPGVFYSRNITPHGLGSWTDGEIYRTITTGVNKKGEALFPVMPYHKYGQLDEEDVYSIIAYVRSLPPVPNEVPAREVDFPFSIILNTIPQKAAPGKRPDPSDTLAYGKYLVSAAACGECHTPFVEGKFTEGMEFAGGRVFEMPGGTLRTPNLTPDPTGLGYWSREKFLDKFHTYTDSGYHSPAVAMTDFNSIMPWTMYSRMTESDLISVYTFLKSLDPIKNEVTKFSPKAVAAN
jgi:mono/diheme cytochrome c family protein